ncbi:hypothetical protein ACF1BN_13535 [Streptomyces sp. NPDC014861]|uniref:hypothetical protein n=1 Tax=Streptomyces sp. NPDC014861 TaxID=3364923 RepID=UPI0036F84453
MAQQPETRSEPHTGERYDEQAAASAVVEPGRSLTGCRPEAYGVRADGSRKLVASGRRTPGRLDRSAA